MTPDDLAALHARCFTVPRPWNAYEFAELLASPRCFLLTRGAGFLLGRVIADEAELLTLAVAPEHRRDGLGRALTAEFAATSRRMQASEAFLEVAADNDAAKALYLAQCWCIAGRRPRYYGPTTDALILRLGL